MFNEQSKDKDIEKARNCVKKSDLYNLQKYHAQVSRADGNNLCMTIQEETLSNRLLFQKNYKWN